MKINKRFTQFATFSPQKCEFSHFASNAKTKFGFRSSVFTRFFSSSTFLENFLRFRKYAVLGGFKSLIYEYCRIKSVQNQMFITSRSMQEFGLYVHANTYSNIYIYKSESESESASI